jgi:hypothetical protein
MAVTLLELATDLVGQIPGLPNAIARNIINRAADAVKRHRLWSWNIDEGILITPQLITGAGTVGVTQFSNSIQFDSTAKGILNGYVSANPPLIKRQFRVGAGPLYNLVAYNSTTGVGTLDRIYAESSGSGFTYSIYRCYYDPPTLDGVNPVVDFLRYLTINNPNVGYTITGRRLYMTREELNRRDPLRGAVGQPYYAVPYKPTTNIYTAPDQPVGNMQYELWPHPTFQFGLICQYEKQHQQMTPLDVFPQQAPIGLIRYKAEELAARWALKNQGRIPELKGTDYRFILADAEKSYRLELVEAKRQDNEILLRVLRPGTAGLYDFWGPIDSNFFQSHGLPAL